MFVRESDRRLLAKVWFGPEAEGPPGHAHGGGMAAVLDHVMGISAWVAGHPVVARKIGVEFHRKLPLGTVAIAEAWVNTVEEKRVTTEGRLYYPEPSAIFASSDGLFIKQSLEKFRALLEVHGRHSD
jgi:acyl-coenzyme A thioesterase PaaI-like protein